MIRLTKTFCLILTLSIISVINACSSFSNNSNLPINANEEELKLVNYIIDNGIYDENDNEYFISESTNEAGIGFNYSITYNIETKKLTFRDTSSISSGMIITTMNYEYEAEQQKVSINIVIDSGSAISSEGIIYPSTYTSSNKTIYSFESTYKNDKLKSICETNVYAMLTHCQLLMIDAGVGMVPFGFEKGLFK